jgi:hypothetical protein
VSPSVPMSVSASGWHSDENGNCIAQTYATPSVEASS